MTLDTLNILAPLMDRNARELANGRVLLDETPDQYVAAYVVAVAETCGALAADQCAIGEEWAPADWLSGDSRAVEEAAELVGIAVDWTACWAAYSAPTINAFDVCGLARR